MTRKENTRLTVGHDTNYITLCLYLDFIHETQLSSLITNNQRRMITSLGF